MVIIEEAHHILSKRIGRNSTVGEGIMDTVFRELREFGVGICLMDQHPSEMSLPALGNTYCTISMNVKSREDVRTLSGAMLLDEEQEKALGNMEVGKAIVKLQGRVPEPFMIHVPEFRIQKGSVTDEMLRQHMKSLADTPSENAAPTNNLSDEEEAFLHDVKKYPESGVVQRYRRLHVSVRHGNELRTMLLHKGMIVESDVTTAMGRKKVTRLITKI